MLCERTFGILKSLLTSNEHKVLNLRPRQEEIVKNVSVTLRWCVIGCNFSSSCAQKLNYTWSRLLCIYRHVCSPLLCEAFWNCTGNCCRIRQPCVPVCVCVWETGKAPTWRSRAAECVRIHGRPSLHLLSSGPQTRRWVAVCPRLVPPRRRAAHPHQPIYYVRSFRMTVARMRKKVFQPRVTAKPRHTMNRDRPQPAKNSGPLKALY